MEGVSNVKSAENTAENIEKSSEALFYRKGEGKILNRAKFQEELRKQREPNYLELKKQRDAETAAKIKALQERIQTRPESPQKAMSSRPSPVFQAPPPLPRTFQVPPSPQASQGPRYPNTPSGSSGQLAKKLLRGAGGFAGSLVGVGAAAMLSPVAMFIGIWSPREGRKFLGNTISLFRKGGEAVGNLIGKTIS